MLLNCDLGESFGSWTMGQDEQAMPHIDQANIACGFHAGDPLVMSHTLALAKQHGVMVGAHPAYPDLVGFGRRSMNCSQGEIMAFMHYQMAAIDGMAACQGLALSYVKPHGALYNDMMAKQGVRQVIMQAVSSYPTRNNQPPLKLMLQANAQADEHIREAQSLGLELYFEAFADRAYEEDGSLMARSKPGAVLDHKAMLKQVQQLVNTDTVTSASGTTLRLKVDSLCVHGDNAAGIAAIQDIGLIINNAHARTI
ncbi:MAG: 5-oxoprolinase subunit PxpA [Gammaproteobacteria bacterium]|nr:5-oxoprolinase subunit PxpA [Gammaproteobacteria bacterium]